MAQEARASSSEVVTSPSPKDRKTRVQKCRGLEKKLPQDKRDTKRAYSALTENRKSSLLLMQARNFESADLNGR